MEIKEIWNSEDWTANIRHILKWSSTIDSNRSMMLLLRHSHRETLQDHTHMASAGLTDLGKQMSIEVGRRIPPGRPMEVYTSFVPRCFETAEGIAQGYTEIGGKVVDINPLPILVAPHIRDQNVWLELNPNGENVTEYVNRWVRGEFSDRIEPFDEYRERFIDGTIKRLNEAREESIFVHVTHDLALMSAKRMLLERNLVFEDREPYLGGIGLVESNSMFELFIGGSNTSTMLHRVWKVTQMEESSPKK
ncbi:MAG: histidine phosphatase family protein [Candidatus Thorarchaeota archaeon]